MIVCHAHRFIFHAGRRSASTCLSVALGTLVSGRDISTLSPAGQLSGKRRGIAHHMGPLAIRAFVGEDTWHNYLTISTVRNPWARMFSYYHALQQRNAWSWLYAPWDEMDPGPGKRRSFLAWLMCQQRRFMEDELFSAAGDLLVERVVRFEHLEADFEKLCADLRVFTPPLRDAAAGKADASKYADAYDKQSRDRVASLFPGTIATYGYKFGD